MALIEIDIANLIPKVLINSVRDTLVDFISEQAEKYAGEEVVKQVKKLRSDASFNNKFLESLRRAKTRFVEEYEVKDEDLVNAILKDESFFQNSQFQKALIKILKTPSAYLPSEHELVTQSFETIFPDRRNRDRVNRAINYFLKCLVEEMWHLPELEPVYRLQFQYITAEYTQQLVQLQKSQLNAVNDLNEGIKRALLQLTDAMVEKKYLTGNNIERKDISSQAYFKVRNNLPNPDYEKFIGREKELAQIYKKLRPYPKSQTHLISIDGIGGIGKSALALEIAYFYLLNNEYIPEEHRFSTIIWASAKQSILLANEIVPRNSDRVIKTLEDIFYTVALTLNQEEIIRLDIEKQSQMIRKVLSQERILLIIDNLETIDDKDVLSFLRELPAPSKCIVTTRHRIDVAYPVRLTGMPWEDGKRLIEQECDKKKIILKADEIEMFFNRTGGVPLAIVWTIAQLTLGYSIESVLLQLGKPTNNIIKFCFDNTINIIRDTDSFPVLLLLSLFTVGASRQAIGNIGNFGEDILRRDEAISKLEILSLINNIDSQYSMLPLTRLLAQKELQSYAKNQEIQKNWYEYFLGFALSCKETSLDNIVQMEKDYENVKGVISWLANTKQSSQLIKLISAMETFMFVKGYWNDWRSWLEIAKDLALGLNDEISLGKALQTLGRLGVYKRQIDDTRQYLERALSIFETHKEKEETLRTAWALSRAYMFESNYSEAEIILNKYEAIAINFGEKEWIVTYLIFKGQMLVELGRLNEAEDKLIMALKISGERDSTANLNFVYWCLGALYIEKGNFDLAEKYITQSLEVAKELRFKSGKAQAIRWMAILREHRKDYDEAKVLAINAKDEFHQLGMDFHEQEMDRLIINLATT